MLGSGGAHAVSARERRARHARRGQGAHRAPREWSAPLLATEPPAIPPRALGGALAAGGAALAGAWTAHPADALTAGAQLTGLGAGYGLLVILLLWARIPAVVRGMGRDRIACWRDWAVAWVMACTLAHAVLMAGTADLWRPVVVAAMLGLGLLVGAVAVTLNVLRERAGHGVRRTVRGLVYGGAALSFLHQSGDAGIGAHATLTLLWTWLHTQVAVLIVWYRLVQPYRRAAVPSPASAATRLHRLAATVWLVNAALVAAALFLAAR
ncbi:hypothetical protein ACRB68_77890 [Actinomadura sp. RB68]|uniref:Uncharacterized protein n=2 Tax=Actinomadura macrotermitis TaxID=2585200 RepID=A0A7K0C886_9ACTN|nr:hypothetical protein [Actinomadura macrotermitis]